MKKSIYIISLLLFLLSCQSKKTFEEVKPIIITGKVLNFNAKKNDIHLTIYRVCDEREILSTSLSEAGEFRFEFNSAIPLETELKYKHSVKVLVYPDDSIHVAFNGSRNNFVKFQKEISYSGASSSGVNNEISSFLSSYYSGFGLGPTTSLQVAADEFDVETYTCYLDSVEDGYDNFTKEFYTENNTSEVAKEWIHFFLMENVYQMMVGYVFRHQFADQTKPGQWQIPVSFYNRLQESNPISYNTFLNGHCLDFYLNEYSTWYIAQNVVAEEAFKQGVAEEGYVGPAMLSDSLEIAGIIKYTPDKLLQQLIFADKIQGGFSSLHLDFYEENKELLDELITEPFLKETISKSYATVKEKLTNPKLSSDAILKKAENTPAISIMDSILNANKGKVIYIDCWADYCGPCLGELPNSKKLMDEMKDENVAFVYLCLSSDIATWKAILAKHQLGGQHYLFNEEQKEEWYKAFNISGIPYYFLIDEEGVIVADGSYLKPEVAKGKIKTLLND